MIKENFSKQMKKKYNDFKVCAAELHAAALGRRPLGRCLLHRLQGVLRVQEMISLDNNKINAIGHTSHTWIAQILTPSCRVLQTIETIARGQFDTLTDF